MTKKRKVYSPAFKSQVTLAVRKGDKTINELAGTLGERPAAGNLAGFAIARLRRGQPGPG
jgi:hypothetical protein